MINYFFVKSVSFGLSNLRRICFNLQITYGTGESYIYIKVRNYNLMASCGFAHLIVGRWCGSSADNPANVQCVVVGAVQKVLKADFEILVIWRLCLRL